MTGQIVVFYRPTLQESVLWGEFKFGSYRPKIIFTLREDQILHYWLLRNSQNTFTISGDETQRGGRRAGNGFHIINEFYGFFASDETYTLISDTLFRDYSVPENREHFFLNMVLCLQHFRKPLFFL
jgi:hypothetical protein